METLDDVLAHYGVHGMKWGVRKKYNALSKTYQDGSPGALRTPVKTKTGETITVEKAKPPVLGVLLNKATKVRPEDSVTQMHILDSKGQKAGSFQAWKDKDHPNTVRGEWLEIHKDHQGQGYSKAAIQGLMSAAKKNPSVDYVRLQVPEGAAPAKHIYSQLGFKKDADLGYGLEDWVADVRTKR